MGDNDEQEDADLDAMNNDGDNLFEVIYRGGRLSNSTIYNIPANVFIRLRIDLSVTKIDAYACQYFIRLTEVIFHGNVTEIGRDAFDGCSNLECVELPEGLLRLDDWAFGYCTSLNGEIVIPASVQSIGDNAFGWCKSLQRVIFAPRTTSIELGHHMFSSCTKLRSVTFPQNLRSIPRRCFGGCTSLINIRIPLSVEVIEKDAFSGSAIQSLVMLENVYQIHWAAFRDCLFLKKVTFHSTTLNFANNIFSNCPSLTIIMIAPWLWPKLFASMNRHPEFMFKFFRQYQTQIFDFEIVNADVEGEGEGTLQHNTDVNNK